MHSELRWLPSACSWALAHILAFASSQTQTYELELFVPQISQAANGELVSITGGGLFSIHPKTVSANGNFTHSDGHGNLSPMEHGLPLDS